MTARIHSLGGYIHEYQKSIANPESFWAEIAENFYWRKRYDTVLEWNFETPTINWFSGGKLNITENIFERNNYTLGNQPAIIWEPNNPDEPGRVLTYSELWKEVNKFANTLKKLQVKKGDRVAIYMPMIPELTIAMLACARIGAIHSVVFAGFSAASLSDRINDAEAKVVLTADGGYRGEKITPLKNIVDEALESCTCVETVVVYKRTNSDVPMTEGRDIWWHTAINGQSEECKAEEMDAEDVLFILYTSGSTGKPKGIVHTTAGFMVYTAYTFTNVFQYTAGDLYFCTADIGWVTGHSYIVYGPLLNGAQTLMFEGIPTWPDAGRFWAIVDKHKVNQFYTAPTAIRSLLAMGMEHILDKDLSSLKVLGTVGEPINEEAWHWYHDHIGRNRCPIVDTWWQTETGG
ncbi:MAG TPA: acetyl-coenzyme A synthetase, partial [Prolixibacteraceae bacterium]|nr:acetyl-coenzyme A synthetase [Prolixibacteraceae bacterium]